MGFRVENILPLKAKGSLTLTQTRHLLLQFTNVAARDYPCIFVLANQYQRHHVLRSVSARAPHANFKQFTEVVSATILQSAWNAYPRAPHGRSQKNNARATSFGVTRGKNKAVGKARASSLRRENARHRRKIRRTISFLHAFSG